MYPKLKKSYDVILQDLFAIGIMFPLLYPYVRELGASHITVGLIDSSYSALQVLTGPLIVRNRAVSFMLFL